MKHSQIPVRVGEKLKVGFFLFEPEMPQLGILRESIEIARPLRFECDDGIESSLASRHSHDLQDGSLVEFVVELILIHEHQIRREREIKLLIAEWQFGKQPLYVAVVPLHLIVIKESPVRSLAVLTQNLRRSVEVPSIRLQIPDRIGDTIEIDFATAPNLRFGQIVDGIEGCNPNAECIAFGAKRSNASRHIKDSLVAKAIQIEREETPVLVESSSEQDDFVQNQTVFHRVEESRDFSLLASTEEHLASCGDSPMDALLAGKLPLGLSMNLLSGRTHCLSSIWIATVLPVFTAHHESLAATITVTTNDSYAKIEAARAGDEVVIAPGTYRFRLYLTARGTVARPIVIRAQDPARRPVWDLSAAFVENAPGSYTAGDRGRGGWQFSGAANYRISGIVFSGCRTATHNSAGIRYYSGTTNLYLKDCVFRLNDNGLTGGSQESDATVEFCEFDQNGNTAASTSAPTHNLYIYGGTFTMRYCYVHDSVQGQNFHIRSRNSTLEYNWFARAKSYEGDLMSDDDFSGQGPFIQTMLLRGNVVVQAINPDNRSQIWVLYNDSGIANLTMSMRVINNTFVGNGGNPAFVHLSNADGTAMSAEVSNNLIYGTTRPTLVENVSAGPVSGVNNWLMTNATSGPLTGSIRSASPGFSNPAAQDYSLASNSAAVGRADTTVVGLPSREYFQNEGNPRQFRVRPAVHDVGAFESTTFGAGVGPYDPEPQPALKIRWTDGNAFISWPLFAADYLLEVAANGAVPLLWHPESAACVTNADGISASIPVASSSALYRLSKP